MNSTNTTRPALPGLGFGAAGIARPKGDQDLSRTRVDEAEAMECLQAAWDEGLRWFDTAPFYGEGRSERMVGRFLGDGRRSEALLSTKVGRLIVDGDPVFDFSANGIRRSLDDSLRRLGTDRVDILLVHDPDRYLRQAIDEAWPVLRGLRDAGVVSRIGLGVTNVPVAETVIRETDPDVLLLAERYSLLDPEAAESLFSLCVKRGMEVAVAGSLSGGLIDGVTQTHFHYRPLTPEVRERGRRLRALCAEFGVPTAAVALQFARAHPAVTALLTGPARADQLRENVRWMSWPVPAEVWTALRDRGLLDPALPVPLAMPR